MAASVLKHTQPDAISNDAQETPSSKRKGKENIRKLKQAPVQSEQSPPPIDDNDTVWNWASLTDPSSSRIPPVFSKDGSYFFSLVASSVKIYSTASGQVISTLTAPSSDEGNTQSDVLTASVLNPHNSFQLITASVDGRIMIWDYVNATLLQTIKTGQPIHYMCMHEKFKGKVFVAATKAKKKASDTGSIILQLSLKTDENTGKPSEIVAIGKTRPPTGLAVSSNGEWLVATAGHKAYVAKTASLHDGFTKYVSPERLRCLSFHPTEDYFATGDDKGVVRLWYCLNNDLAVNVRGVEKRTQTRALHWHAHAVSSLSFTPNGAYLLTGGEESVLVIWQLATGKKEFIPRLGAPVSTVSIVPLRGGEEEYLVGLSDATYTFISSASLKVSRSYSRIKIDPSHSQEHSSTSKLTSTPLAIQPLTSTLMLPSSHPSSLQIYSPPTSTLVSELEVSPSNRVSRRDEKPLIPAVVETAVVSASGLWMATIDYREADVGFRSEVYLKIWSWDRKQNNWILNTRIDHPHGSDKVTDISFSPNADDTKPLLLVTTGNDGLVKVWKLWKAKKLPTGNGVDTWATYSTLTYRSEVPTSISWSPDSSLFAVAMGAYVVLFDAVSASVRQSLTSPSCTKVQSVRFIGADGCHLLAAGENMLVLWDLIDMEVSWEHRLQDSIYKVVAHTKDSSFAVFQAPTIIDEEYSTKVTIFDIASNIPKSNRSVPFGLRNVIWNSTSKRAGYNLVGITHTWRVVSIGDSVQTFNHGGSLAAKGLNVDQQPQRKTLFQDIFGASAFAATAPEVTPVPSLLRNDSKLPDIFNTPAYLAPSLEFIFEPLVKSMLVARPVEVGPSADDVEEDEDVAMEDEPSASASISALQPSRMPVPGEMDAFVKLFKQRCMTETPTVPKPGNKLNGVARLKEKEVNGSHRPAETPLARAARRSSSQADVGPLPVLPPSPSPLVNGKKRKKASS